MKSKLAMLSGQEQMEVTLTFTQLHKTTLHLSLEWPQLLPTLLHFPKLWWLSRFPTTLETQSPIKLQCDRDCFSLYFSPPHPHQFQFLKHHNSIYYYKFFASTICSVLCVLSPFKTTQQGGAGQPILLRVGDLLQGDLAELELKHRRVGSQSTFDYSCCLSLSRWAMPEDAAAPFWGKWFVSK